MCNNIPGCLKDGSMNRASMVCVSGCEDIPCKDVVDISNVGNWAPIAPMRTSRSFLGLTATSNGKIYAVGGSGANGNILKSAEVYDPKLDTWHNIAPMDASRAFLGLAAIDDKIYAVGGSSDGNNFLKTAQMYDPSTTKWTDISSMTTARANFGLASLNGKLYAVGGYGLPAGILSSVEVYDPGVPDASWVPVNPMLKGRTQFGIAALEASDMPTDMIKQYPEGLLYVAGGAVGDNEFDTSGEFYDPSNNKWRPAGSLDQSGLWWPGMASLHGKIYIVGGSNLQHPLGASGEVYDVSSTGLIHMSPIAHMSEVRAEHGLAALNGKLYAVGGTTAGGTSSNTGEVYTPNPS
jgi:hypothetical protein